MLAIENTIAGSLLHNYELLRESGMTIVGEHKTTHQTQLHVLAGRQLGNTDRSQLPPPLPWHNAVKFLIQHPKLKIVETEDTAGSAEAIKREN